MALTDAVTACDWVALCDGLPVPDWLVVDVGDGVPEALFVAAALGDADADGVPVEEGVNITLRLEEAEAVADWDGVDAPLALCDWLLVTLCDTVALCEAGRKAAATAAAALCPSSYAPCTVPKECCWQCSPARKRRPLKAAWRPERSAGVLPTR